MVNIQKAAVIGCGFVGSTIAYTLMQQGTFSELVLIDAVQAKGEGEAMDISHGIPFAHSMDIHAGNVRGYCGRIRSDHHGGSEPEAGGDTGLTWCRRTPGS